MRILFFALRLMATLALSCKSKKKIVQGGTRNLDSMVFTNIANGKDSLMRQEWQHLSGRIAMDYDNGEEEIAATISLRMRRDSIMWFSVNAAMGIQVAKGIITRDSVKVLDLFNKKYIRYSISELGNQFGANVGLHELQNMITGNPVFDTMVYSRDSVSGGWLAVNVPVSNFIFSRDFQLPDSSFIAEKGSMRQMKTEYRESMQAGKVLLPKFMDILATGASKTVRIRLEFKTASDDVIPSYPFAVPEGYETE